MDKSGFSRCATLAILYLSLYKKSKNWKNIQYLKELVSTNQKVYPNMKVIKSIMSPKLEIAKQVQEFQDQKSTDSEQR